MLIHLWGHLRYFLTDFWFYLLILILSTFLVIKYTHKIYKSQISERKKNLLFLLLFTIVSLIYVYCGFEAYFRYRFDESDSLGFLNVTERWYARHAVYNNYQYRDNKNWTYAKTPGVVRIGVMGDSNAFGYGIKNVDNRFSNLLDKKLKSNGYNVEIYNFAVPGLGNEGELDEYNRIRYLNFDVLIWSYFLNDAEEASRSAGQKVLQSSLSAPSPLILFLSHNSFFFDYIYWRLSAKYDPVFIKIRNADLAQYNIPDVFNHHKELVASMSATFRSQNMKIVTIIFPFLYFFPNYPANAIEVHKRMDNLFMQDGVSALVDMYDYVKGKKSIDLVVGRYDSHPNEYVHKLAADKLYNAIIPLLEKTPDKGTIVKQ